LEVQECSHCKEKKPLDDFHKNPRKKLGVNIICKSCWKIYHHEHYLKNIDKYKERANANREIYREKARAIVLKYLENGCIDCGERRIVVLEFDHRENKKCCISKLLAGRTRKIEPLIEELEKCDVRCANCHRVKTARDFNWWKHNASVVPIG
jgi:hypothetical protein